MNRPEYQRQRWIKLDAIRDATSGFNDAQVIWKSERATTYKAQLIVYEQEGSSPITVAVMRRHIRQHFDDREIGNQVEFFYKLTHKNLVRLLGTCEEDTEVIMIYEYMSNGSLANHLNGKQQLTAYSSSSSSSSSSSLSWEQRLKICIDVARGLEFLKRVYEGPSQGIIPNFINPTNIILDESMVAKLFAFEITRSGRYFMSTRAVYAKNEETNAYVDPLFYSSGLINPKMDVYAFGMVLLELLCGKLPAQRHLYHGKYNKEGQKLRQWAEENIDTDLREQISPDCFHMFVDIVEACTMEDPRSRPHMAKLVLQLEHVLEFHLKQNYATSISCVPVKDNEKDKQADNSKKEAQKQKSVGRKSVRFQEPVQEVDTKDSDDANHSAQEHEPAKADIISSSPHGRFFRQFSLAEIRVATKDFDPKMVCGKGGEAMVYRGTILVNGGTEICVAVKRLIPKAADLKREIEMLSMMQHENLVSLLGSCQESGEKILIYEYMPNGSLDKYLWKTTSGALSWERRLKICIGAASGLEYLHTCPTKSGRGNIHRDVKPVNILLDENWVAKIADFGLAKKRLSNQLVSEMATRVRGTPGYYAPEYLFSGKVTRSVDVYAFGIVMFEVLCRKRPWASHCADSDDSDQDYEGEDIRTWAKENIDKNLKEPISENCLDVYIDVAAKCFDKDKEERPIMSEVVSKLKYALQLHTSSEK